MTFSSVPRYFAALAFAVFAFAAGLLGAHVRHQHLSDMSSYAEGLNVNLTQQLGVLLAEDVRQLLHFTPGESPEVLQRRPAVQDLREKLAPLLSGSQVVKVKVYDLLGVTVFST